MGGTQFLRFEDRSLKLEGVINWVMIGLSLKLIGLIFGCGCFYCCC